MTIPKPFARVRVCVRRFEVDRHAGEGPDHESDGEQRHRLESLLNEVTCRADDVAAPDA